MAESRRPGPMCTTRGDDIDDGTMCLTRTSTPGAVCMEGRQDPKVWSPACNPAFRPIQGRDGTVVGYFRTSEGYSEVRNTDGEIVWADEIPLQPGIPVLDTAVDAVVAGLKHLGYAAVGTLDTVLENNWAALGLPLDSAHRQPIAQILGIPLDSTAYSIGRGAGHLISLLQAAAEVVGGVTLFIAGTGETLAAVATTPAGVGVVVMPVAVVTVAAGATVIVHGGVLGTATLMNMTKDATSGSGGGRRKYNPNPKHEQPWAGGRRGTKLDLKPTEAEELLNDANNCRQVPGKRQFLGVKDGKIYAFQDDSAGGYHAYEISGQEVTQKYPALQKWVAEMLGTTVKRLSGMQ